MKIQIIHIIILTFITHSVLAQTIPINSNSYDIIGNKTGKWTILYDKNFNITDDISIVEFYRLITYEDGKPQGIVVDYYLNGQKQWEGFLLSDEPEDIFDDGEFKLLYKNGEVKEISSYRGGVLNGTTLIFNKEAELCMNIEYDKGNIYNYKILKFDSILENYLYNLAITCADLGNYPKALELNLQDLEITEQLYGKEHSNYAISLNNLALNYSKLGDYSKALEVNLQSLRILEENFGKEHPYYVTSLNNLALTYSKLGDYSKALELQLIALDITENIFGKEHLNYTETLNNLALTYADLGNYPKALELNLQDLEITEQLYGKEHSNYAISLNNLALTYSKLGDYYKALELNLMDLEITKKNSGNEHHNFVKSLINLAGTYSDLGNYSKALKLNLRALVLTEKLFGKEHSEYAVALNNLANTYSDLGDHQKALELNLQDFEITEQLFGKEHHNYAISLKNLALTYSDLGDYSKALELNLQNLVITEQSFGKESSNYIDLLNNLAFNYVHLGDLLSASSLFNEVQKFNITLFKSYENKLNNNLRNDLYEYLFSGYKILFSINRKLNNYQEITNQYNYLCFLKGRELSKNTSMSSAIYDSGDIELINSYENWININKRISLSYEKNIEERKILGLDLNQLQERSDKLERQLTIRSSIFTANQRNYSFDEIVSNLKENEIYIDIANIPFYDFERNQYEQSKYYAYVIRKGDTIPQLVTIGSDNLLNRANGIYDRYINDKTEDAEQSNTCYNVFWSKFDPYLKGISTVYFSPDGVYNKINPNVLYDRLSNVFLMNKFDIVYVSNVEDFVHQKENFNFFQKSNNLNAVIIGDPTFNLDLKDIQTQLVSNEYKTRTFNQEELNNLQRGTIIRSLPGTKEEINVISKKLSSKGWKTTVYSEKEASEENLKKINAPRILHIATHGYFFKDNNISAEIDPILPDQQRTLSNPLFRSGLLFAGAENSKKGELLANENGWLNSYEASLLNLRGTELVVLSACETASGDVINGKGVYGLQRAIRIAGAESIIMSMWKVDDRATQELMGIFYDNWIDMKMTKKEAFKEAQNILRKKYIYPYYWGAFIMIGK